MFKKQKSSLYIKQLWKNDRIQYNPSLLYSKDESFYKFKSRPSFLARQSHATLQLVGWVNCLWSNENCSFGHIYTAQVMPTLKQSANANP